MTNNEISITSNIWNGEKLLGKLSLGGEKGTAAEGKELSHLRASCLKPENL